MRDLHPATPTAAPPASEGLSPWKPLVSTGDCISSGRRQRSSQRSRPDAVRREAASKSAPTPSAELETNIWQPDRVAVQHSLLFHFTFLSPALPRPHLTITPFDSNALQRIPQRPLIITLAVIAAYKSLKPSPTVGLFPPYHDYRGNDIDWRAAVHFMDMFGLFFSAVFLH